MAGDLRLCVGGRLLGRCVSSLKNLFFMLLNWWLEWWEGGCGGGGSFSLPSSSAALRIRGPSTLTNRIAALVKSSRREKTTPLQPAPVSPFLLLSHSGISKCNM